MKRRMQREHRAGNVPGVAGEEPAARAILVVTGASGVGKSTAVRTIVSRGRPGLRCFELDSIGVPSAEVMERDFGGPEGWQADATRRWIARLARETPAGQISVLDGQTRPSFVLAAHEPSQGVLLRIVLVECTAEARRARLAERGQPDLATTAMDTWAAYLRGQADALGLPVVESTGLSSVAVADRLEEEIAALRRSLFAASGGRRGAV